jgi:predicted transcriptional regulator
LKLYSLRPHNRDIRFALGDLEAAVLRELWALNKPVSVKEFQVRSSKTRALAVTTVATILDRLYQKGLVSRQLVREGGPHYLYRPRVTEKEFQHEVVDNVMGTLLHSFNDVTVAYLAERMGVPHGGDERVIGKYLNRLRKKAVK